MEWDRTRSKIDVTSDLAELAVYLLTGEQLIAAQSEKWLSEGGLGRKAIEPLPQVFENGC